MRRARRLLAVVCRAGIVASAVLVLSAAVASEVRYYWWSSMPEWTPTQGMTNKEVVLAQGRLWYRRTRVLGLMSAGSPAGLFVVENNAAEGIGLPEPASRLSWRCFKYQHGASGSEVAVDLPLWPLAGVGVIASYFGLRGLRWGRTGRCRGCGYELAGLNGGVCPECGRTADALN